MSESKQSYKGIFLFLCKVDVIPITKIINETDAKIIAMPLLVMLLGSLTIKPINRKISATVYIGRISLTPAYQSGL